MAKLTDKQKLFCKEYLIDLNATQAALRAKYSKKTATDIACENLGKPNIQDEINRLRKKAQKSTDITVEKVLKEYSKIAFCDVRNAVDWGVRTEDGKSVSYVKPVDSDKIDDHTAAAITEVSLTYGGVKLKMGDKKAALDSIAKHLGMFDKDVVQTDISDADILRDMANRMPN